MAVEQQTTRREWWLTGSDILRSPDLSASELAEPVVHKTSGGPVHVREVLPGDDMEIMQDIRVEVNGELRGRYANIEVMKMHMASVIEELDAIKQSHAALVEAANTTLEILMRLECMVDSYDHDQRIEIGQAIEPIRKQLEKEQ